MRNVMRLWRRSIQTRVVASTILLSTLVIGATGWALLSDVADGLADSRRNAAIAEARSGFEVAQAQLDAALESEPETQAQALTQMVDSLTGVRGGRRAYELVLEGPLGGDDTPVRSSAAIAPGSLPSDLRRSVIKSPGTYWSFSGLSVLGQDDPEPAVAVGSRLRAPRTGDSYAMFYLFSMKEQQATLDLVRQALLFGGLAMVLMVGGVAWLVSRQVLNPVRLARRIAERYASGSLEQRMHVSGEDDIARLSTSFNQMAASLQSQIRRLENLSRLQQRFVSDVSHELRTPLTTVQMASSVLFDARERFDPQTARSAELLKSELDRFEELLSNLLDLSRFDAGAARLELDAVDLAAIARAAADDPLLERQGIEVRLVGTDEPAVVEADIRRIDRIVRNLLTNAAKYSGSPVIEIEVAQDDEHVSLAVRDFGVGLTGDENLRVFDRFWRADPARTQGGTGLGLPISREDAVLHGGSLQAWGRPGEGSEFVLTLPKTVPAPTSRRTAAAGRRPWSARSSHEATHEAGRGRDRCRARRLRRHPVVRAGRAGGRRQRARPEHRALRAGRPVPRRLAAADRAGLPRRDARLPGLHRHRGPVPDARGRQGVAVVRGRHRVHRPEVTCPEDEWRSIADVSPSSSTCGRPGRAARPSGPLPAAARQAGAHIPPAEGQGPVADQQPAGRRHGHPHLLRRLLPPVLPLLLRRLRRATRAGPGAPRRR